MKRILIYGSCVSRDVLSICNCKAHLVEYFARSTFASAFTSPKVLDRFSNTNESEFQAKMINYDFEKTLREKFNDFQFDILLIDFIDERLPNIILKDGSIVTLSNELRRCNLLDLEYDLIEPNSNESFELWEQGWIIFINACKVANCLDKIRLVEALWSDKTIQDTTFEQDYSTGEIEHVNIYLRRLYDRAKIDLKAINVIEVGMDKFIADENHPWGKAPFHFQKSYYQYVADHLNISSNYLIYQQDEHLIISNASILDVGLEVKYLLKNAEGISIRIEAIEPITADKCCLVSFKNYGEIFKQYNPSLVYKSENIKYGWYTYLNFIDGVAIANLKFENKQDVSIELILFRINPYANVDIKYLYISPYQHFKNLKKISISVDVEALLGRAVDNQLDKLIWGNYANGRAGIIKFCEIFKRYNIPATFYLEYGSCAVYGDAAIFEVGNYLKSMNFDVQLHVHPELLIRSGKVVSSNQEVFFNKLDVETATNAIRYGVDKFQENIGHMPEIFRPGGMLHNASMYEACAVNGLKSVSAIFRGYDKSLWEKCENYKFFRWTNQIKEIPLDLSCDPLTKFWEPIGDYLANDKSSFVQILLHSWSLSLRNQEGMHETYSMESEDNLIQYIEVMKNTHTFVDHKQVMDDIYFEHEHSYGDLE